MIIFFINRNKGIPEVQDESSPAAANWVSDSVEVEYPEVEVAAQVEVEAPVLDKPSVDDNQYDNYVLVRDGVKILDIKKGNGDIISLNSGVVVVNLVGWIDNFNGNDKFESTYDTGEPYVVDLNPNTSDLSSKLLADYYKIYIEGMSVGGMRNIIVPPESSLPGYEDTRLYITIELTSYN